MKCPICSRNEATVYWEHITCGDCYERAKLGEPITRDDGVVVLYLRGFYTLDDLRAILFAYEVERREKCEG